MGKYRRLPEVLAMGKQFLLLPDVLAMSKQCLLLPEVLAMGKQCLLLPEVLLMGKQCLLPTNVHRVMHQVKRDYILELLYFPFHFIIIFFQLSLCR